MISPLTSVRGNTHQYPGSDVEQREYGHNPGSGMRSVLYRHPCFYSKPDKYKGGYQTREQVPALRTSGNPEIGPVLRRYLNGRNHHRQADDRAYVSSVVSPQPSDEAKDRTDRKHQRHGHPPRWWRISHPPERKPPTLEEKRRELSKKLPCPRSRDRYQLVPRCDPEQRPPEDTSEPERGAQQHDGAACQRHRRPSKPGLQDRGPTRESRAAPASGKDGHGASANEQRNSHAVSRSA